MRTTENVYMKTIKIKYEELKQINLESFDIDTLVFFRAIGD